MGRKRWPIVLATLAAVFLLAVWLGGRMLRPERITGFLVAAAERATGLDIDIAQPADYAFRPQPRLRLSGVRASVPGTGESLLDIGMLDVTLPWDTLLGGDPVIRALRIDRASIDTTRLMPWLDRRPKGGTDDLPVLEDGLEVRDSTVLGDGWGLRVRELSLPGFALDTPLSLHLDAAVRRTASASAPELPEWPFTLTIDATPRRIGTGIALDLRSLDVDAASPLPSFRASGAAAFGDHLALGLEGELKAWPADWPSLPLPVANSSDPLHFQIKTTGGGLDDLDVSLTLLRGQSRVSVQALAAQLQAWWQAEPGSPLPPLRGELQTDRIEIDGTTLEGIRIDIAPDPQP